MNSVNSVIVLISELSIDVKTKLEETMFSYLTFAKFLQYRFEWVSTLRADNTEGRFNLGIGS